MQPSRKTTPPSRHLTDPHLWERIRFAELPDSIARHEFAVALAYQIDVPIAEARDVVREYRRFLYLATITDEHRVPPEPVRKAWAMHALSPDYAHFCANVLNKALVFDDGTRKFGAHGAYRRTLSAYLREFGAMPPATYWPPAIKPRLPRWLAAHASVLGLAGALALHGGELLILAIGVALSLAIYGLDLYGAYLSARRRGLGAAVSDDLAYFLSKRDAR